MSLTSLLNQTVTIYAGSNVDRTGKLTFTTGVDTKARFERTSKTIQSPQNTIEPIDGIVFVKPTVTVSVGSKLVYSTKTYKVMSIDEPVDDSGSVHHKELMVQEWSL